MASATAGHGAWGLWDASSVIVGDEVTVYVGAGAYAEITAPVGIPAASDVTRVTLALTVSSDGSSSNPGVTHVAPLIQFGLSSSIAGGHIFSRYTLGATSHTALPYDTASHDLLYDSDIDSPWDPVAFATDVLNASDPLVMVVGEQQVDSGGYLIYYPGVLFTFYWASATTTTVAPPLRLTNRGDMFGSARRLTGSRSRQGSNRLTGYL